MADDGCKIIPKCLTCTQKCKKYVAPFLFEAFEKGESTLMCKNYEKIKEVKEIKESFEPKTASKRSRK